MPTMAEKRSLAHWMLEHPTPAESRLQMILEEMPEVWERQVILLGWIVDFYSARWKVVVEADGSIHDSAEQRKKDWTRDGVMWARGFTVLRMHNEVVLDPKWERPIRLAVLRMILWPGLEGGTPPPALLTTSAKALPELSNGYSRFGVWRPDGALPVS